MASSVILSGEIGIVEDVRDDETSDMNNKIITLPQLSQVYLENNEGCMLKITSHISSKYWGLFMSRSEQFIFHQTCNLCFSINQIFFKT